MCACADAVRTARVNHTLTVSTNISVQFYLDSVSKGKKYFLNNSKELFRLEWIIFHPFEMLQYVWKPFSPLDFQLYSLCTPRISTFESVISFKELVQSARV